MEACLTTYDAARIPRVSVLINNYNNGRYLATCINSVLVQTQSVDEVILFDDGSTDTSRAILARYENKITVIFGEHGAGTQMQNQSRAIDAAFAVCTGDVIFLLDGDDVFLPKKVEAYLEGFRQNPDAVMVQAPLERIDPDGRHLGLEFDAGRHRVDYRRHIYASRDLNIFYPTSALAFTRPYLEERLPLDFSDQLRVWPDGRLALTAPLWGKIITLPMPYTQWRRHPQAHTIARPPPPHRLMRSSYTYFNSVCRAREMPTIAHWKNFRYWSLMTRYFLFSERQMQVYRKLRWAVMGSRKRAELLSGDPTSLRIKEYLERNRVA
jgi:glycosyltransferase involved in cell wall biosynthesis